MFTGLIEEVGVVREVNERGLGLELVIGCQTVLEGTNIGDSIAVNGVCLTVTRLGSDYFAADVMPETRVKTQLDSLQPTTLVNLERAVAVGQRMGGHFVQGHVDGIAKLVKIIPDGNSTRYYFQTEEKWSHFMVEKGSIALNGVSLTLVEVESDHFSVSLIPHTLEQTQFHTLRVGDHVNLECDLVGKYLAKWSPYANPKIEAGSIK